MLLFLNAYDGLTASSPPEQSADKTPFLKVFQSERSKRELAPEKNTSPPETGNPSKHPDAACSKQEKRAVKKKNYTPEDEAPCILQVPH